MPALRRAILVRVWWMLKSQVSQVVFFKWSYPESDGKMRRFALCCHQMLGGFVDWWLGRWDFLFLWKKKIHIRDRSFWIQIKKNFTLMATGFGSGCKRADHEMFQKNGNTISLFHSWAGRDPFLDWQGEKTTFAIGSGKPELIHLEKGVKIGYFILGLPS